MSDIYTLDNFTFISDLPDESLAELSDGLEAGENAEELRVVEERSASSSSGNSNISSLVCYTAVSPNKSYRTAKIEGITIHHMAGNLTVERCGEIFAPTSRKASSNYGIGTDGRIACYVPENFRAWTSSSSANDNRCVTIEVADSVAAEPWPISDAAYESLIQLCADICLRNGIKALIYTGNTSGNLTAHRWFAATACVPVDSEVLTRNGWVKLRDVEVGDEIACADLDGLRITFEEVYAKVPTKTQDTYTNNDFTATKDHRMVYRTQSNLSYKIRDYGHLLRERTNIYIPLAGYADGEGLPLSNDMLAFYIAVQADGHYMYEKTSDGAKSYYGLEFHFTKPRKIERIKEILDRINLPYNETLQSNGTAKIRVYNHDGINIVEDICEKHLKDKSFTWDWLNLSPEQARFFLDEIMLWDGCVTGSKYTSVEPENLNIVNAIAAVNGVGSRVVGNSVFFRETPYITLGENTKRNKPKEVSCVSVKTGIFLVRQYGKTFIIGNCPGPYLYERFPAIAKEVTKRVEAGTIYAVPEKQEEKTEMTYETWCKYMERYMSEAVKSDPSPWAKAACEKAIQKGIMKGDGSGAYNFQRPLTREAYLVMQDREGLL